MAESILLDTSIFRKSSPKINDNLRVHIKMLTPLVDLACFDIASRTTEVFQHFNAGRFRLVFLISSLLVRLYPSVLHAMLLVSDIKCQ